VRVAESDEIDQGTHNGPRELSVDLLAAVVVTINVPSFAGPAQLFHVIPAGEEADVIHLWNAGSEELNRARNQVLRLRGRHAARELADRLERRLEQLADRGGDDLEEDL